MQQKYESYNRSFVKPAQLLGLIFLFHVFFPLSAYANGMAGIVLAPFYFLFLIFLSTCLAAFFKFLLLKIAFKKTHSVSIRYLLALAIMEMTLIALFIIPAHLSMPRDIALGITKYALCVSDEIGIWYFGIYSNYKHLLFWCVILSISGLISLIFMLLPNVELLRERNQGLLNVIRRPRNVMMAGFCSLITPVILSMMFLLPWMLEAAHPNSRKYTTAVKEKNKALNELFVQAASTRYPELVEAFLKKGADVNFQYGHGKKTAIIKATSIGGNLETVKMLLNEGADVNAKDRNGFTALMGAVFPEVEGASVSENQIEVVRLMLENGADVNAKDSYSKTALMRACAYNREVEVTKLLLENGADINEKDKDGKTALMQAVFFGKNPAVVRVLLENGADVNAKDKYGKTALMRVSRKQYHLRELLLEYGAKE